MSKSDKVEFVDQDQINRAVWSACDTFRGTVDSSIYKDYVLTMLFLKYISDVWQDKYDAYKEEFSIAPEAIEAMLMYERFVLPKNASFQALFLRRNEPGNGLRIDQALYEIGMGNHEKLRNVFQDIHFNSTKLGDDKHKDEILCHLLDDFNKSELNLRPSRVRGMDIIGNAYEFLIRNFASGSGKKAGEFYTPPEVSELIALLADPVEADQICDPTCGSGSLLMKCGQLVRQRYGSGNYSLYGQEAIGSTWALAKMNMFLHGEDNHQIEWGDTLRQPKLVNDKGELIKYDVVVANPPFSLEKWGVDTVAGDVYQRFNRGLPPRTKADFAFILHMIATMKPGTGRMAVVVPNGVLFRGGAEGSLRKKLILENLLDVVIGLPEKLFYGTGIAAVILIFRSQKSDENILFVNATHEYRESKGQNVLRPEDINRIWKTVQDRAEVPQYSHLAGLDEIIKNDYNLNMSRYVSRLDQESVVDLAELRQQRDELKMKLAHFESIMDACLQEYGVEPPEVD